LLNKKTSDAHDNPTLSIDAEGYLWVFSNSHGTSRPSYIHRSAKPYSIDSFELVVTTNFSYGQPWYLPDHGFVFMHTRYSPGAVHHRSPEKLERIGKPHKCENADGLEIDALNRQPSL
jgi:hypothetical protein